MMNSKDINILVVEDEKIVSVDIKRRLISLGYKVIDVVSSGEKAIESAASLSPDLILMDIMLEGKIDGIEAAMQIKNLHSIPVVFLTAYTDDHTIERAKIAEPFGYILKPFEIRDLRSTLEIALYKAETQKKLKENEQWLNTILNNIGEAVIALDSENKIKFMNPVAEELTGISAENANGKLISDVYNVINEISDESLIYSLSQNENISLESLLNNKMLVSDTNVIPIEENYAEIKNERNQVIGTILTFRDISKRRAVESAIIASRNYYLSLFEEFPALIWRSGNDGKFNYFNRTWLEFTGRNIEDEIEYGWLDSVHEDDRQNFRNIYEAAFHQRKNFEYEIKLLDNLQQYRSVVCIGSPFCDMHGKFTGYIGACYDVTARRIMEEQLKEARDKAEESSKAKTIFLSNMSHEIRTPMNGIIGISELLIDSQMDLEQKNYLGMLRKSAFSLLNLLNSILDYSKYEAGKLKLEKSSFSIELLVEEVTRIFLPETQSKGVRLSYEIAPNVPPLLIGDSQRIKQVLINLLSNAVKFTEKGIVSLSIVTEEEICFHSREGSIKLHFTIEDTGIGIEKAKHEVVFESFTQADSSTTKKYGGTGLGLTISKQIVQMMDGDIWFESRPGEGTTFHVILSCEAYKDTTNQKQKREIIV